MYYDYEPDYEIKIPENVSEELKARIANLKKSPYYPFYLICNTYKFGHNDYGGVYCIINCYDSGWRFNPVEFETPTPNNAAPGCPLFAAYLDMTNRFSFEEIIEYANRAAEYYIELLNKNSETSKKREEFERGLSYRDKNVFFYEASFDEEIDNFGTDFREFDEIIYQVANCSDGLEYLKI